MSKIGPTTEREKVAEETRHREELHIRMTKVEEDARELMEIMRYMMKYRPKVDFGDIPK